MLRIRVGPMEFTAHLEEDAPKTIAAIRTLFPMRSKIIQARWSGEAAWVPLGDLALDLSHENANSYPGAGELLLYPGGYSETEILFPYGATRFASRMGQLAGNHFATIAASRAELAEAGRLILWEGAQDFEISEIADQG